MSRETCLTCGKPADSYATRVSDNGASIVVCADCMADLNDGNAIGTAKRTQDERRAAALKNLRMTITVTTPSGRMTGTTPGPAMQNIPVPATPEGQRLRAALKEGRTAQVGCTCRSYNARTGEHAEGCPLRADDNGDDNGGLSSGGEGAEVGRQSSGRGRKGPASGWPTERPTARLRDAAKSGEDIMARITRAYFAADTHEKELALMRAIDPRIIGVVTSREQPQFLGVPLGGAVYTATVTVPDPSEIDVAALEAHATAALKRLIGDDTIVVRVIVAQAHTSDNPQVAVDVDLLDFPEFARTAIGLSVGVRVCPIRAVWDLLATPHLPLRLNHETQAQLPASVRNDTRVLAAWDIGQTTIRRLRARLREGVPNIEVRPRYRYGRITGLDNLTGHAVVDHGDGIVMHWPTHVLMTVSEDDPLPPDLIVAHEDDNPAPTFDPDDFRSRRRAKH